MSLYVLGNSIQEWRKEGELMAVGCKPEKKTENKQEGFARHLSKKSCKCEYFMTCPRYLTSTLVFFINYYSFFCHAKFPPDVNIQQTINVQMLHFSTEIGD